MSSCLICCRELLNMHGICFANRCNVHWNLTKRMRTKISLKMLQRKVCVPMILFFFRCWIIWYDTLSSVQTSRNIRKLQKSLNGIAAKCWEETLVFLHVCAYIMHHDQSILTRNLFTPTSFTRIFTFLISKYLLPCFKSYYCFRAFLLKFPMKLQLVSLFCHLKQAMNSFWNS